MKYGKYFIFAAAVAAMAGTAAAGECTAADLYKINSNTEAKIQQHVLAPMLGQGKAFVFLEMTAEVKTNVDKASKGGIGQLHKRSSKAEEAAAGGKAEGQKAGKNTDQTSVQEQTASDEKSTAEKNEILKFAAGSMKARIIHDAGLSADKLKAVKEALVALYPGKIKPEDIVFVPAAFIPGAGKAEAEAN